MWIARDKSGELYLYSHKPEKSADYSNWFVSTSGLVMPIRPSLFPEVTWENSPVEVELKLTEEIIDVAESPSKTFSKVNDFEVGASYRR